jgi:hypothetical protein
MRNVVNHFVPRVMPYGIDHRARPFDGPRVYVTISDFLDPSGFLARIKGWPETRFFW